MQTGKLISNVKQNSSFLTNLLYPSQSGGWRDIVRAGWKPAFFNQQWGGAPILGGLDGDLTMDYASGYLDGNDSSYAFGYDNTIYYGAQGFKVSSTQTVQAIRVKLLKVLNPTGNCQLSIYDDNAGSPNAAIANGAATAIAGTLITSDANGAWYRFVFATPPSLTANVQYHIVVGNSSNSTTNFYRWVSKSTGSYKNGTLKKGTNAGAWSSQGGGAEQGLFAIEPTSTYRFLQSGGAFDYKIVGNEGTPLDQSYGLTASLKDIGFNPYETTWMGTFTNLSASKPFAEFMYGLDHDRISLSVDASNHVVLKVYNTDQATTYTVTGTTAVNSGTFDIGIYVRAKADGADVVKLFVNGVSEGTPLTAQTITFDYAAFRELGTAWILGGFPAAQ